MFYVPDLTYNLLSVGQLFCKKYLLIFYKDECTIKDKKKNLIMAKVKMNANNVYLITMLLSEKIAFKREIVDESYLWHLRYGHLNYKGLELLKDKNMVLGLPSIVPLNKVCEGYIYRKNA